MKEDTLKFWCGLALLLLLIFGGGYLIVGVMNSSSERYKQLTALHSERYGWEMFPSCKEVDNNNGFCFTCEQKKVFLNASEEAKLKMMQIQIQKEIGESIEKAGKQVGNDIFWSRFLFGK